MSSHIDNTIDRLSAQLRVLDSQNAWLEAMIENWDAIQTPPTRPRRNRSPPPSPPRDRLGRMLDMIEATHELIPTDDEDEDEEDPFDLGEYADNLVDQPIANDESDTESIATVVYTSGGSNGTYSYDEDSDFEDSDTETVVGDWKDPCVTPWTEAHADYFFDNGILVPMDSSPGW